MTAGVVDRTRVLLTGGSGRLGTELRGLLPGLLAPPRAQLDITHPASVSACFQALAPRVVVHLAAFTQVSEAERSPQPCWNTNVNGTMHVAKACAAVGAKLVHISTDYVFSGQRGMYNEHDPLGPPANYYALTKLVAEQVALAACPCLVIRTSFRPRQWPYPKAFTDVYTSQDYVDIIAPMIAEAIDHVEHIDDPVLHIATERKSVYELARRRCPHVLAAQSDGANVAFPKDVSLDCTRWHKLRQTWTG